MVNLACRDTWSNPRSKLVENISGDFASLAHLFNFVRSFDADHATPLRLKVKAGLGREKQTLWSEPLKDR
jgi:hypothetical protein